MTLPSNIIIQDHEVDLDVWLKEKRLKILVHKSNLGWRATFNCSYSVEGAPAGPLSGDDAFTAVLHFVNWMFGAELSTNLPGEPVPRFTEDSIRRAVAHAAHTDPTRSAQ